MAPNLKKEKDNNT